MEKNKRGRLPDFYEIRYHSELLKEKIADDGMWSMIPAVRGSMHSSEGIRRLKENDLLFLLTLNRTWRTEDLFFCLKMSLIRALVSARQKICPAYWR